MNKFKETVLEALHLGVYVVLLAIGLAYVDSKWLAPHRIPPCHQDQLPKGKICLTTVLETGGDKVIWIDARNQDAFERGTIKRGKVLSIRNDENAANLLMEALPVLHQAGIEGKCIVVFCDRSCNSATEIANTLRSYQLQAPIYVLEGGWDEIRRSSSLAS